MKSRFKIVIIIIFTALFAKAQTKFNHIVGIDIGYASGKPILNYKLDVNTNYIFAYKHFMFKVQTGINPNTNFGNISKLFLVTGFTTKLNTFISWNFLIGIAFIEASKNKYSGQK